MKNQFLRPEFFEKQKFEAQKAFRKQFVDKHRSLKSAIHLCQHKAYQNEALIRYEEAESAAKNCFLPLLVIRRHGQVMVQNIEYDMDECFKLEYQNFEENKAQMKMTKD